MSYPKPFNFRLPFSLVVIAVGTLTLLAQSLQAQQWTTNNLPPGLFAWWRAEGDAADLLASNPGTAGAGVSYAAGKVGSAFRLVNAPDSTIQFPNSPGFAPANRQLTIMAWVKPDFTSANAIDTILEKRDACNMSYSFIFSVLKAYPGYPAGVFGLGMLPQISFIASTNRIPDDGQFHHVAVTYNGNKANANCVLYLDGQIVGGGDGAGPIPASTAGPIIGLHRCLGINSTMLIDEVGFFDRELSAAEIAGLAGDPPGPVDLTDDFSTGLNSNLWSVDCNDAIITLTDTNGEIHVSKPVGGNGASSHYLEVNFARVIQGDFDASVDIRNVDVTRVAGSPGNQIQLNTGFGNQYFCVVRSDESGWGQNAHVWRNPPATWAGTISTTATNGTLRVTRVGSTVTAFFNGTALHSASYNASPVTYLALCLQNNGTRDAMNVVFDNFHLKADRLLPKPPRLESLGATGPAFQLRLLDPTPGCWHWVEFSPCLPATNGWSVRGRIVGGAFPADWNDTLTPAAPAGFYRVRSQ